MSPAGKSDSKSTKNKKGDSAKKPAKTGKGGAVREAAPVKAKTKAERAAGYVPRLKVRYRSTIIKELMTRFGYKNPMQVPKLEKVVLNVGLGEAISNAKLLDGAVSELSKITGQRAQVTVAKKSIAGFKLRAGSAIGAKVTLRGDRMYEFVDKLVSVALPRIRDFRGVSPKAFDGRGNYSLGLKEQLIFPEIGYDEIEAPHGMDVTFVTSAGNNEEGQALLALMGMPFRTN